MNIKLIGSRVAVKRDDAEDVTPGGIIKPDMSKEPLNRGVVMAVGGGEQLPSGAIAPMSVKRGDKVIFGQYGGIDLEVDGEKIAVVLENDILCVIED